MLQLTEIKLPLAHAKEAISKAIIERLGIAADDLIDYTVFRRGVDARKKSNIQFIYTLHVAVRDEAATLERCRNDPHVKPAPDTTYHFVAHAPSGFISKVEQGGDERTTQTVHSARPGVS